MTMKEALKLVHSTEEKKEIRNYYKVESLVRNMDEDEALKVREIVRNYIFDYDDTDIKTVTKKLKVSIEALADWYSSDDYMDYEQKGHKAPSKRTTTANIFSQQEEKTMATKKQVLACDYMIRTEREHYVYTETFTAYTPNQAHRLMSDWKEHGWTVTILGLSFRTEEYQIHRF